MASDSGDGYARGVDHDLIRRRAPWAVGLLALVVFAWGAPPGPTWLDSQELGAAGAQLGVAHPSGFPLALALSKALSLLPLGELAWRVHLASAVAGALAVGLTTALVLALAPGLAGLAGAVGAGCALAASMTFYKAAVVTEVYASTAAAIAGGLLLLVRALAGDRGAGLGLALLYGVAATGLHASARLLLALPVLLALGALLRRGARWVLAAPALVTLGALGAALYLPIRSARGPQTLDWGHPRTLGALIDHLSAGRIRRAYAESMLSPVREVVGAHARTAWQLLDGDLGVPLLCFAAIALVALAWWRGRRVVAAALGLVAALDLVYAIWVNPMGLADRQDLTPFAVVACALAGVGIEAATRRAGTRAAPALAALLALIAVVPAASGMAERAAVRTDVARAWGERGLDRCASRATAQVTSDSLAATLFWLTTVEGARPEVAVLVRQHAWDHARTEAVAARVGVKALKNRALCWEPGADAPPGPLSPEAPLARVGVRDGDAAAEVKALAALVEPARRDPSAAHELQAALSALALRTPPEIAAPTLALAAEVDPSAAQPLINAGVLAASHGDLRRAAALDDQAIARDPLHVGARINAARHRLALNEDAAARAHAAWVTRVAPKRVDGWLLLGTVEARAGAWDAAAHALDHALGIDPKNEEAKLNRLLVDEQRKK